MFFPKKFGAEAYYFGARSYCLGAESHIIWCWNVCFAARNLVLESIFLVLNRPIFGARSSFFGAGNLVLESTVLVLNRMLSDHQDEQGPSTGHRSRTKIRVGKRFDSAPKPESIVGLILHK